ncbi:hypothetical protein LNV23_20635 [Paucibacter sp. DJ1R-11]|uniref:hypothetical protein n=1 Tax=Paucibacter sp. DJ1R-11 TaxID=2893556 RepID=UPI0021E4A4B6|nr:hypothetical protein [Paucibacter sp. DJ1R-11]MCV2365863.1 hypothetical protein [Paucibacter sp. DJ1R-11]
MAAASSQALEISPPRLQSALHQPLQVQIALRLTPGDKTSKTLSDPCFKVDVSVGDRLLKPAEFMRSIDWQAAGGSIVMRVQTHAPVAEPVVVLSLGCPRQQFSLMLEPSLPASVSAASAPARPAVPPASPVLAKTKPQPVPAPTVVLRHKGPALRLDLGLAERSAAVSPSARGSPVDWYAPLAGIRLLMALDVGGPLGAMPSTTVGVEGPRPDRIKQAEAQFVALQAEQKALHAEMGELSDALLAREQRRAGAGAQAGWWALGLATLAALGGVGGWWWLRRQRRGTSAAL